MSFRSATQATDSTRSGCTAQIAVATAESHVLPVARRRKRNSRSANVAARDLVDPQTHAYLSAERLREKFKAFGALDAGRVITYCGGGIAASSDAFVLTLLGKDDIALYDASLSEWAADASLPMERD